MPNVISTFSAGTKIAIETDRSSAPSGVRLGKLWSEGGRWFDVITTGLPTVQDTQAVIFPQGHAGDRRINQQPPVVGRQWSEGDFNAPVVADFMGVLLYAAMGSLSTNMVPSGGTAATASLLTKTALSNLGNILTLASQPCDGGAILRIEIAGIVGPGTLAVCGIDAYGNGASESVTLNGSGEMYTRTSFSSIGASGLSINGLSAGNINITGIRNFVHTFTQASVAPTLAMERIGHPTAGEASANKNFLNVGMVLKTMALAIDSEKVDGLTTVQATFEGDPSGASTKTLINAPSMLKIWPSWDLQISRDQGTAWNVVENVTFTVNTGNTVYRAAAGTQGPQGAFFGATEYLGNITILLNNELEFAKWKAASEIQMLWNMQTPWKLAGSTNYSLAASVPAYFNKLTEADTNGMFTLGGDYRVVRDDNFAMQFQLVNGTPGKSMNLLASV
jgi:hypothetical protein